MTREFIPPQEFAEYKLLRSLGRGAMGQVYLAHNTLLDRQVALKFLDARAGEGARDRLLVEARAIARLEHPNVARLYQLGATSDHPFLEMEYVPGRPLSEEPLPLPWRQVLAIACGLARGLAAAHQHGVLHRDIKPANILLGKEGQPKLLDFGLAKLVDALPIGTPMPPQLPAQAAPQSPPRDFDATWSLPAANDTAAARAGCTAASRPADGNPRRSAAGYADVHGPRGLQR